MKTVFTVSIFILTSCVFSQSWKNVDQSFLNIKYKLPSNWGKDGFGSDFGYWDDGGSSVCDCAGTINSDYDTKISMVIYPTDSKTDPLRREIVWDYKFVPSGNKQTVKAKKLTFEKEVSKWELLQGSDEYNKMLDDVVWKLTVNMSNYGLIIYFWGDEEMMKENESTLLKILDTMVMIKK